MAFRFFTSEYNPTGLSGLVGGGISSLELSGYLGELFSFAEAYPIDVNIPVYQYRKLFVVNNYGQECSDVRVWIDSEHVTGQIELCLEYTVGTTGGISSEPVGLAGSWSAPKNYAQGLAVGSLLNGESKGVWLRQTLVGISSSNPYASLRLYAGGVL